MTFRKEGGNEVNKIKNKWYTKYAQTRTKAQFSKVAHACQKKKNVQGKLYLGEHTIIASELHSVRVLNEPGRSRPPPAFTRPLHRRRRRRLPLPILPNEGGSQKCGKFALVRTVFAAWTKQFF